MEGWIAEWTLLKIKLLNTELSVTLYLQKKQKKKKKMLEKDTEVFSLVSNISASREELDKEKNWKTEKFPMEFLSWLSG